MPCIRVIGGRPLHGCLSIQGAKNAVLPIMAATLCTKGRCTLLGCPDICDVHTAIEILQTLGCEAEFDHGTVRIDTGARSGAAIPPPLAEKMRSSVTFLGALMSAAGEATVPLPGGCVLGARPLDLHLSGLQTLGAEVSAEDGTIRCRGRLCGGTVVLRYPSVGATENLMLAALDAEAPVTIIGAAKEPEIVDLGDFLNACGAQVSGAGSATIRVSGGAKQGCTYRVMPDRMAAASYLCAAAASGGSLTLTETEPTQIEAVLSVLRASGCEIETAPGRIALKAGALRAVPPVVTGPYPAFPTDAQAPVMAALCRAEGVTVFDETVFENRYRHVPALVRLGADIQVSGSIARVRGVRSLHGADMIATDLRGGAAMLIAALSAEGESRIFEPRHLLRGYEHICANLRSVGAEVTAEDTNEPDLR